MQEFNDLMSKTVKEKKNMQTQNLFGRIPRGNPNQTVKVVKQQNYRDESNNLSPGSRKSEDFDEDMYDETRPNN